MAARTNGLSELTRFWLTERHGCLVRESVPVPVPYNLSDIDFVAMNPANKKFTLPDRVTEVGPRLIVESKDEHDWEPVGTDFALKFHNDQLKFDKEKHYVPAKTRGVCFSMLRQEHYDIATNVFNTQEFDRVFVVHAVDPSGFEGMVEFYREQRVFWVTAQELLDDLRKWYKEPKRRSGLRNTLMGDLFHLLFGYLRVDERREEGK